MVDPWGKILAECNQDDASVPQCQTVKISLEPLNDVRKRLPCFSHRRNDVYALAPLRLIPVEKSLLATDSEFQPIPIEDEETPYFLFEKYPVPKATTFLESPMSIAFTNVTCVVPGRKFYYSRLLSIVFELIQNLFIIQMFLWQRDDVLID